jgi:hypothetical protein
MIFNFVFSEAALSNKIYHQKDIIADKIENNNSNESKNEIKMILVVDLHP